MMQALKKANVPAEAHLFQLGAHGFGIRKAGTPLGVWPQLALAWMKGMGFLDPAAVREYAPMFTKALGSNAPKLPRLGEIAPKASMADAYASQKRVIATAFGKEKIVGYKGAASSAAAQKSMKVDAPLHCALFEPAMHKAAETKTLDADEAGVVETEIAYVMGVDIPTHIEDPDEARTGTQHILPAIELPGDFAKRVNGKPSAVDMVASNCGGTTRVLLGAEHHPDKADLAKLPITLTRGGQTLNDTTGAATKDGQWQNLMTLINQIIDSGRIIREGDIILSGAIGAVTPAEAGSYVADFGELGKVEFNLN
jgi:2-keto-4-pentenoate hydratase